MRLRNFLVIPVLFCICSLATYASVLKVVINDTIQAETAERIERALDQAAAQKS